MIQWGVNFVLKSMRNSLYSRGKEEESLTAMTTGACSVSTLEVEDDQVARPRWAKMTQSA
jgi:hypothetical protein